MRILAACLVTLLFAVPAAAQDRPDTILVLDGSGSMWGQIDGVAKITIAQRVVAGLLQTIPPDLSLGLTVYGHRRKGDCNDIETVVPPGPGTRDAILTAVNAIKPKGKTPMTDAVKAAAEALRYTEDAATVILVSDGIETCNPDPCAAARVLEETGVNFTAHVVGFDVTDAQALAQMRCIAEETGGRFLTAANAGELSQALQVVAEPPAPAPVDMAFTATEGAGGPIIAEGLSWTVTDATGAPVLDGGTQATPSLALLPGTYTARVTRAADRATASAEFRAGSAETTVTLVLPPRKAAVELTAPASAPAGAVVSVGFALATEGRPYDRIVIRPADGGDPVAEVGYINTDGRAATMQLPAVPGDWDIAYVLEDGRIAAHRPVAVTAPTVRIEVPATVPAGAVIAIAWTGKSDGYVNSYDGIEIVPEDGGGAVAGVALINTDGSGVQLQAPAVPGRYKVVYRVESGGAVIAESPLAVSPPTVKIEAPASVPTGSEFNVSWTGRDDGYTNAYDGIEIVPVDGGPAVAGAALINTDGATARFQAPAQPGRYKVVYRLESGGAVIAESGPIVVGP